MYGVTVQELMKANGLANANVLYQGQKLVIPVPSEQYGEHVLQPGETLLSVANKYDVSVWDIARLNGLWNIITSPASDEVVSNPVVVTGWGSAFENTLVVDVLDGAGVSIGQGFAIVEAEVGQVGPFTGTVEFVSHPQHRLDACQYTALAHAMGPSNT